MDQLAKLDRKDVVTYLHAVVDGYVGRHVANFTSHDRLQKVPPPSHSQLSLQLIAMFEESVQQQQQSIG